MFKKLLLGMVLSLMLVPISFAQRTAVVDIAAVLENVSDYKKAQEQLDKISSQWQQQISEEYDAIKSLYNKYQTEQVFLSEEMKQQREEEIMNREKAVRDLQKKKFGQDGELFSKRQELVQPIQDRVYDAIEDFAAEKGFDLIFDKSSAAGLIFANESYDKTDDILKKLGAK
jgi:outer membrane protein